MPAQVPRYTAAEIRQFPDHRVRYEVIRGQLFMTPAPGTVHQRVVRELQRLLHDYVQSRRLGEALAAPYEVEFTEDSAVQPDVLVIVGPQRDRLTAARFYGPPALVIEVVSYSSKRTDRLEKRDLYLQEGVPEYWIVDTEARAVERWLPDATRPQIVTEQLAWQPVSSIPPLNIDFPRLFAIAWEGLEERG